MRVYSGGVGIEVDVTGEPGAPMVLLLHGFPDCSRLWRHQVPALHDAGFRVAAIDQRGFGRSDRPARLEQYSLLEAAGDVTAVLDELDVDRAHVVGHDFGAALAWVVATFLPDRVDHLVAMSVGHPAAFRLTAFEQASRSWYMLLFAQPDIAESWLRADDWANLRAWSRHPDIDAVIAHLESAEPGADPDGPDRLTSALNWYRANVPVGSWIAPPPELPPVAAPTMGVWSADDFALTEAQMVTSGEFVAGPWRYERIGDAGHWMQLEAPSRLNELLVDFLPA